MCAEKWQNGMNAFLIIKAFQESIEFSDINFRLWFEIGNNCLEQFFINWTYFKLSICLD